MSVVVIGGDYMDSIEEKLGKQGIEVVKHITGRKTKDTCSALPKNAQAVIFFTDYINHNTLCSLKNEAKKRGMKTIFSRRSWSHILQELQNMSI